MTVSELNRPRPNPGVIEGFPLWTGMIFILKLVFEVKRPICHFFAPIFLPTFPCCNC
jgi:hypothetical protein